jgi:general secretion pathway protein J
MKKADTRPYEYYGRAQSGFTLLELLVSITLIGLIVVIVGGAMRLGYRSVDKGEKKVEMLERFKVSLSVMDAQIQSGMPLKGTGDEVNQYYFKGKKDSVRFASNYSLMGGQRGYVLVAYRVEVDKNDKRTLYAKENTIGMENQKEVKLLEGFEDIHFEYFLKDALEAQSKWVEEWTDDMNFPQKVRIHLAWGNQRISLVVPVRARLLTAQSAFGFFSTDYPGGVVS